jgi:hypothetical protein
MELRKAKVELLRYPALSLTFSEAIEHPNITR